MERRFVSSDYGFMLDYLTSRKQRTKIGTSCSDWANLFRGYDKAQY